ncbi:hypothetical protein CYMTET_28999 [Cymbomonas tetramitiformis]|uniref:Uncharacterized protein n=1 Tax=Cymbomonas tetramitiformis TaxID=36881 RepID=A0AAE0KVE0_9CHLO|nr:hypothetical protein CYMTET_28999 [Cymbomonas tetramitiformis]
MRPESRSRKGILLSQALALLSCFSYSFAHVVPQTSITSDIAFVERDGEYALFNVTFSERIFGFNLSHDCLLTGCISGGENDTVGIHAEGYTTFKNFHRNFDMFRRYRCRVRVTEDYATVQVKDHAVWNKMGDTNADSDVLIVESNDPKQATGSILNDKPAPPPLLPPPLLVPPPEPRPSQPAPVYPSPSPSQPPPQSLPNLSPPPVPVPSPPQLTSPSSPPYEQSVPLVPIGVRGSLQFRKAADGDTPDYNEEFEAAFRQSILQLAGEGAELHLLRGPEAASSNFSISFEMNIPSKDQALALLGTLKCCAAQEFKENEFFTEYVTVTPVRVELIAPSENSPSALTFDPHTTSKELIHRGVGMSGIDGDGGEDGEAMSAWFILAAVLLVLFPMVAGMVLWKYKFGGYQQMPLDGEERNNDL